MSILFEKIITIIATIAGSVAIAFTTFYLQERNKKKKLFRALYSEVNSNIEVAQRQTRQPEIVFERAPLHFFAYENIQLSGELLDLPEETQASLREVYELIYEHNRQLPATYEFPPRDRNFKERAEEIVKRLKKLKEELPQVCKYL